MAANDHSAVGFLWRNGTTKQKLKDAVKQTGESYA
jgi:hypothetical protein